MKAEAAGGSVGAPSVDKALSTAATETAKDDSHRAAAGVLATEVKSLREREAALTDLLAKSQRSIKKMRESQSNVDAKTGLVRGVPNTAHQTQ